jgi:ferredoxin
LSIAPFTFVVNFPLETEALGLVFPVYHKSLPLIVKRFAERLEALADALHLPETLAKPVWLKIAGVEDPPDVPFIESRQWMDEGFHADATCTGCGTCARICPVHNVAMVDDPRARHPVPTWQHRCEQCFACLQWCPEAAIQFGAHTTGQPRYHHPDVTLADMRNQAS